MLLTYSGYKQNYCKLLNVYTSNFVVYDEYGNFVNYLQLLCSKSATGKLLKFMILVIFGNRMFSCSVGLTAAGFEGTGGLTMSSDGDPAA
jgi:hypothetical protein